MRRFIFVFSFIFLCLSNDPVLARRPLKIVTTFYPLYIMTINVVGHTPGVEVVNLTPTSVGCLHDYALTARDMKKLADADVLVANGAQMESFLQDIVRQFPRINVVFATGMPLSRDPARASGNPHVWVSLWGAEEAVRNIALGLMSYDQFNGERYKDNAEQYALRIESLRQKMHKELSPYRGAKIVTFHEAFPYFAEEFGFEIAAVVERDPGSAPSARELAQTIDLVKRNKIKFLFSEPQYPSDAAQAIARETGARVLVLDPAVTGPMEADAYLQTMERNLKTLTEAFR